MAEALGSTNTSRVIDLWPNGGSIYTPGYAIYEGGNPARVVLFNYIDDVSGANDYTANIAIGGQQTGLQSTPPSSVTVRYMRAPALGSHEITWAGEYRVMIEVLVETSTHDLVRAITWRRAQLRRKT